MNEIDFINYLEVINWVTKMHDQQYLKGTSSICGACIWGSVFIDVG